MPGKKRPLDIDELLEGDPEDSDYDNTSSRPKRHKATKKKSAKGPARKKKVHRGSGSDDDISEDDDDGSEISLDEEAESEQETPERNELTGRPVRSAARKAVTYEESDEEEEEPITTSEDEAPPPATPRGSKKGKLVVKLKMTPQPTSGPSTRTRRARSASLGQKRQSSEAPIVTGTRRSSRHIQDEPETLVALTNSGNHAEVVREGTRSPSLPPRAYKGGKGIKAPSKSTIDEEEESNQTNKLREQLEIAASQNEVPESDAQGDVEEEPLQTQETNGPDSPHQPDSRMSNVEVIQESPIEQHFAEEDEDDDPITRRGRTTRSSIQKQEDALAVPQTEEHISRRKLRSQNRRSGRSSQRRGQEESSDFEPAPEDAGDEDVSSSGESHSSPRKGSQRVEEDDSSDNRRSRLRRGKAKEIDAEVNDSEVADELAEELQELRRGGRKRPPPEILYEDKPRRRNRKTVDYRIIRPDLQMPIEDAEPDIGTPSRRGRAGGGGGGWQRSLLSTYGPFGGAGGPTPVLGGPAGAGATGGVDSDSSDDETMQRPRGVPSMGGTVGMTPTSAFPPNFGLFAPPGQAHGVNPLQDPVGTPANLGKIKDKQALADADPLGVDQNVNFDSVGGLQDHIDHLKEMVALPLLYPEIFTRFHIVPPRGVLFHGPPGTGKTLLARALASSVSSQGRKVTFYMRKGADALSKWVGEAEKQLRLLFEEARKNQPSIIFFDEIDGLAPVRSSKQEQIHASIVSTLLALMDGMDGRGQVIVIGATNRPDSIDPALRRPGRFDREFYFPLPNTEARRAILDIHTKGWEPPLTPEFKNELAELTKGYGGADLRALCTESALNSVQRRYPQIYSSNEKLVIDPKTISIGPKDFMISIKKMVPSSERATSSGASPLPRGLEPLLRLPLGEIKIALNDILPRKKKLTALEEAQYEVNEDVSAFKTERMQQEFERSRVFRPRFLIRGALGMGQQYLAAAVLNHLEGVHVQSFALPSLLEDSTISPEATVVRLFSEVKRHKPSIIYIPNVQAWYDGIGPAVLSTFLGLLRSLPPTDPILLLGVLENEPDEVNESMLRDLFGYSKKSRFDLTPPRNNERRDFFTALIEYVKTPPNEFPDPENRKKRKLEILKPAPAPTAKPPKPPTKEEQKEQKKKDRLTLNMLKIRIQPIMDKMKKYKKFRTGPIDENQIRYLYDEEDPTTVSSDLPIELRSRATFRPYEKEKDAHGEAGLKEVATGKFFYNIELVTMEKRLSNGYYKRPKDFLGDVKRLAKDAKNTTDQDRLLRANELLANVEVDIGGIELADPAFVAECENVYLRELEREKEALEKAQRAAEAEGVMAPPMNMNIAHGYSGPSTNMSSGPVILGEPLATGRPAVPPDPITPSRPGPSQISSLTNGTVDPNDLNDLRPRSNGSSHPSNGDMDVQMGNTDDPSPPNRETQSSSFGQSAQPRPIHSYTAPSLQLRQQSGMSQPLSQKSVITPMAPGSQAQDYINDASTTTGSKKTSDPNSGPQQFNTQSTNGIARHSGPDLSLYHVTEDGQMPDTQNESENSTQLATGARTDQPEQSQGSPPSSSQSQRSQPTGSQPPVPAFDAPPRPEQRSSIHNLVNTEEIHPTLTLDSVFIDRLHDDITQGTSGFSVEQLEQVNTAMMESVWRMRGDWNRNRVGTAVRATFEECVVDMRDVGQEFAGASMHWGAGNGMGMAREDGRGSQAGFQHPYMGVTSLDGTTQLER